MYSYGTVLLFIMSCTYEFICLAVVVSTLRVKNYNENYLLAKFNQVL